MADKERSTQRTPARNARAKASEKGARGESRSGAGSKSVEDIRTQLAVHIGALRFVNGAMAVCIQALQQQDADMDAEIALVLQRTAGDKLDETTDRLEAIALGIEYDGEEV